MKKRSLTERQFWSPFPRKIMEESELKTGT